MLAPRDLVRHGAPGRSLGSPRRPSSVGTIIALVLTAQALVQPATVSATRFVDYLYIAANEGTSSGGHAALQFARDTYHFQHHPGGVLRLHRDDSERFLNVYGNLENRPIHVSRIGVSDETFTLLRDRFNQRYLADDAAFATLDALDSEASLLTMMQASTRSGGTATLEIPGAGYFFPETDTSSEGSAPQAPALVALRGRIESVLGPDILARRIDEVAGSIARLRPDETASQGLGTDTLTTPRLFSRRYLDLATGLVALRVLRDALPLQPASYYAPQRDEFLLSPSDTDMLRGIARQLVDDLTQLMTSARPDWGFPLLVGMARLQALHASIDSGRLVFLDTFPADHVVISGERLARYADALPELLDESREQLANARSALAAQMPAREADAAELEAAANRLLELQRSATEGTDLRVSAAAFVPARSASVASLPLPNVDTNDVARSLSQAHANQEAYADRLEDTHRYHLLTRNCVSEIFETINAAFTSPADGEASNVARQSRERLGGFIGAGESLTFIPFVSADAVQTSYNVAMSTDVTPYRRARLAEMYAEENPLLVYLRESNTITSTIYRHNRNDSSFLFFTDDTWLLRPLYGAANVATGAVTSIAGLVFLPAEGTSLLVTGLRGMLFSIPELAFVNLRKGSFDYVPRKYRLPPPLPG